MRLLRNLSGKGFKLGARGFLTCVGAVAVLGLAAPASAATFTVNTTVDQALGSCDVSCSLRDAVTIANPGDTIQVPAGHYVLTLGEIFIDKNLTITGAGARSTILDGNGASRIFFVMLVPIEEFPAVEITDVSLVNGRATTDVFFLTVPSGGAILSYGSLTLRRCMVANSEGGAGGGIVSAGYLTVDQCTIAGNRATDTTMRLGGGGIFAGQSFVTITNSTLTGNTTVEGSTGGGAHLSMAKVSLINVTVTANQAPGGGGGLAHDLFREGFLTNTIVAGNLGGDCLKLPSFDQLPFESNHSLDSDDSCEMIDAGSLPGVDPLLAPLADNGGPTDTHALLAASPALDAANNALCPPGDQRGIARPQGPACDIGAFERAVPLPDCSQAVASPGLLWPPNHEFIPIEISGITNPDGGTVMVSVTSIFQDEPVNGLGSGDTSPDGTGLGTGNPSVRAERDDGGNGRVYHLSFTATNAGGGLCTGTVTVGVPKNRGANGGPVDDGPLYDSTLP